MSAGFIVKMVVLFVAVGGGTYFFDASGFSWYDVKLAIGDLSRFQAIESSQQAADSAYFSRVFRFCGIIFCALQQ